MIVPVASIIVAIVAAIIIVAKANTMPANKGDEKVLIAYANAVVPFPRFAPEAFDIIPHNAVKMQIGAAIT